MTYAKCHTAVAMLPRISVWPGFANAVTIKPRRRETTPNHARMRGREPKPAKPELWRTAKDKVKKKRRDRVQDDDKADLMTRPEGEV